MSHDLHARGVDRLMVEGGGIVHTQFLTADLADELHLVVAPFFIGNSQARRFVNDGHFPFHANRRAPLAQVRQIDDHETALTTVPIVSRARTEQS